MQRYDIDPDGHVELFDRDIDGMSESLDGDWVRYDDYADLEKRYRDVLAQRDRALRWNVSHRWFWWKHRTRCAIGSWFDAHLRELLWRFGLARCPHIGVNKSRYMRVTGWGPRDGTEIEERCRLCGIETVSDYS